MPLVPDLSSRASLGLLWDLCGVIWGRPQRDPRSTPKSQLQGFIFYRTQHGGATSEHSRAVDRSKGAGFSTPRVC